MKKVLHIFENYLPKSQAWLYLLLTHMQGVENTIASLNYLKNDFLEKDKIIGYGVTTVRDSEKAFSLKNRVARKVSAILSNTNETQRKLIGKEIQSDKYDIIHFHFASIACDFLEEIQNSKQKLFISFYGYDYEYLPKTQPNYLPLYHSLFRSNATFLTEGSFGKEVLKKYGVRGNAVMVQKLGVDIMQIPKIVDQKETGKLKLIQIADFRPKKGHIDSVKALKKAIENNRNIHLTFVGRPADQECYDEVIRFVEDNQLTEVVTFKNWIDYTKIHSYLSTFDVFIHPSKYSLDRDCEGGAPIILLDAQAIGLPVISTTHCDIPEEVIDGKTGLLVAEGNVEQLSEAIISFYEMDKKKYVEFTLNARSHVGQEYDIRKNALGLVNKYLFTNNVKS